MRQSNCQVNPNNEECFKTELNRRFSFMIVRGTSMSRKESTDYEGILIPGGLFVGLGIGIVLNQTAAGALVGLGIGFIMYGLVKALKKN